MRAAAGTPVGRWRTFDATPCRGAERFVCGESRRARIACARLRPDLRWLIGMRGMPDIVGFPCAATLRMERPAVLHAAGMQKNTNRQHRSFYACKHSFSPDCRPGRF